MPALAALSPVAATPGRSPSLAARRPGAVALVCSSCAYLGDTALLTGASLVDLACMYVALTDAGVDVEIVSVGGGPVPVDPASLAPGAPLKAASSALRRLAGDPAAQHQLADTRSFVGLVPADLAGVVFLGGRGAAWDLMFNAEAAALACAVAAAGGVVGAVGHGAAALVGGEGLVKGRSLTCYTNAEEDADGGAALVPALLESRLKGAGAVVTTSPVPGAPHAVRDGRCLVTGQNSASAPAVAKLVLEALSGGVAGLSIWAV